MKTYDRPKIVVSKCLGFEPCRYNGSICKNDFVNKLSNYVDYVMICPETAIGLKTPRDSIRLVKDELIEPKTSRKLTNAMTEYAEEFINHNYGEGIEGFIFKAHSPSCGIHDVKIYDSEEKGASSTRGNGLFSNLMINKFRSAAIEDDGRLTNYRIREHFLIKIFTLARFNKVKEEKSLDKLIEFHQNNKLLITAYNQKELKILGNIVSNKEGLSIDKLLEDYEDHLQLALSRSARYTSKINVLMKAMGYFKDKLTHSEKEFILDTIDKYRQGILPFHVPLYVIKNNIIRFNEEKLINQTFFDPYPEDLVDIKDSAKERN